MNSIRHKGFLFQHFRIIFWLITFSFSISSCKIFRSNKSTANTHTHKTEKDIEKLITKKNNIQTSELISMARTFTGVPYKSGGTTDAGMDCSGLIFKVCQNMGLTIPRISYQQAEVGIEIDLDQVQKGDLVFFNTSSQNRISHVGLVTEVNYPEKILFIHSTTSKGVREDNVFTDYWKKAFAKATRPFVF